MNNRKREREGVNQESENNKVSEQQRSISPNPKSKIIRKYEVDEKQSGAEKKNFCCR